MTAPEPHNPPLSRRAVRVQRERDAERAVESKTTPDPARRSASDAAQDAASDRLPHTVPLPVIDVAANAPASAPMQNPISSEPAAQSLRSRTPARRSTGPTPTRVGARRAAPAPTRRAAKTAHLMDPRAAPPRHARSRRVARVGVVAGLAVVASLVLGSAATVTAAVTGQPTFGDADVSSAEVSDPIEPGPAAGLSVPLPARAESIPAPTVEAAPAALGLCTLPAFASALAAGDDAAAIAAAGGAEAFRTAVAGGTAPCVALDDPARVWVVINKARPNAPIDYWPATLAMPEGVRNVEGVSLRSDAAAALSAMVGAAASAGAGEIALMSGFRSYSTQQTTYANHVSTQGVEQADLSSARPGFSEHQSGLAGDVFPCADGCGTLDDVATSAQGQWILQHAWEYGWITRYEDGYTSITGYVPEPWHLRYIGTDLARAYHDGGWRTLEEFFGLPAAPTYLQ